MSDKKQMSIYLTEEQHRNFRLNAVKAGRSMNSIIEELLEENGWLKEDK